MAKEQQKDDVAQLKEGGGMISAIKEGVDTIRNSTLGRVAGKVWDEMAPAVEAGAHEAASLLYRGDAFVMYPHAGKDDKGKDSVEDLKRPLHGPADLGRSKEQELER